MQTKDTKAQPNVNKDVNQDTVSVNSTAQSQGTSVNNVVQNKFQSKEKKKVSIKDTIKRIRTYKEDIAEAIRSQKASLTSITAAEQMRTTIPTDIIQKSHTSTKKIAIIVGSILLVALGIFVIVFFTFFYEKKSVAIEKEAPSFFIVDKQKKIDITDKSPSGILKDLNYNKENSLLSLGQIENLYITKITKKSGTKFTHTVSSEKFLTNIHAQVSDAFLRSLEPPFMIGIHSFNQNQPFIIFKLNSYQNSFRGMLEWEKTMYNDLFPFFGQNANNTLGAQTNPKTGKKIVLRDNFEDEVIRNIDVRALLSVNGDIKLLYAFPNQQTLIITTNKNTLIELMTRLNSIRVF